MICNNVSSLWLSMLNMLAILSFVLHQEGLFFLMFAMCRPNIQLLFSLQRDMLDVNQIMKDLASMVHEQGDTIGEILIIRVRV